MKFMSLCNWLYATGVILLLQEDQVCCAEWKRATVPLGLDEFIPVPGHNPRTPEKVALGR